MPDDTLEEVRLLSNLESNRHKLLQIVLFGQPELDETLAKPDAAAAARPHHPCLPHAPARASEVAKYLVVPHARRRLPRARRVHAARVRSSRAPPAGSRGASTSSPTRRCSPPSPRTRTPIAPRHVRAAIADSEFAAARKPRLAALRRRGRGGRPRIGAAAQWIVTRPRRRASPPPPPPSGRAPQPASARDRRPSGPESCSLATARRAAARAALERGAGTRLDGYSAAGPATPLAERLAATPELLERAGRRALRAGTFLTENTDPARMERFLLRAREIVPLEALYVIPIAAGGNTGCGSCSAISPAGRRRSPRAAPAAALPAGVSRRTAQLRRACGSSCKTRKTPARQAFTRLSSHKFVLSLLWEGVPRMKMGKALALASVAVAVLVSGCGQKPIKPGGYAYPRRRAARRRRDPAAGSGHADAAAAQAGGAPRDLQRGGQQRARAGAALRARARRPTQRRHPPRTSPARSP